MSIEKPKRRMTLQELLVNVEKFSHAFEEYMKVSVQSVLSDVREVSRPRRRHSLFPTVNAVQNSLTNLRTMSEELKRNTENMAEWLNQVDDHVQRAKSGV